VARVAPDSVVQRAMRHTSPETKRRHCFECVNRYRLHTSSLSQCDPTSQTTISSAHLVNPVQAKAPKELVEAPTYLAHL